MQGNFRNLDSICRDRGFTPVNGILFDLGLSSHQLASDDAGLQLPHRVAAGHAFRSRGQDTTASYWVNEAGEEDLADLIWRFGEERQSRRIARAIVNGRPMRTTTDLAKAVEQAVGRRPGSQIPPRHQDVSGSPHRRQPGTSQPG